MKISDTYLAGSYAAFLLLNAWPYSEESEKNVAIVEINDSF